MHVPRLRFLWVLLASSSSAPSFAQLTQRVSVPSGGGARGSDFSADPEISDTGRYVVFRSAATNLVPYDTNGVWDVFLRDRLGSGTTRVSLTNGGGQANGDSGDPTMSTDGAYVAFQSVATDLVTGDTNGVQDIFLRDRFNLAGTKRISLNMFGLEANGASSAPSISADGRYVVFESAATDMAEGDTNASDDIFVRDTNYGGFTVLVSVRAGGLQPGDGHSRFPHISADARYVVFSSAATNLVAGDTNGKVDVFVRDRQLGTTERVSFGAGGVESNDDCWTDAGSVHPISSDGRYVAFYSAASNLVAGDTNAVPDVFVRDRIAGVTQRVSVGAGGVEANDLCSGGDLSADGRFVAFYGLATNLVPGDTNSAYDVFLHDRQSGTTERLSIHSGGAQGDDESRETTMSTDGRFVAFWSSATNLVSGDTNGVVDVFVRDRGISGFTTACIPGVAGVRLCPCHNPPAGGGLGCDNFGVGPAQSGSLAASGNPSLQADTLVLLATGENNTSTTVFWTATDFLHTGFAHGGGVRCGVWGMKPLYTGPAAGGAISRPGSGDPSVSARMVALGIPLTVGETRHYFTIYRDPLAAGLCGGSSATVNLTNAVSLSWGP